MKERRNHSEDQGTPAKFIVWSGVAAPGVDGGGFRLPDAGRVRTRQMGNGAPLRGHGDPVICLGHHCVLAGNGITHHREAIGGADKIEAYGKAAVVGADGEIEHASAVIHTLRFGNHYRSAVGAKTYLAFTNTRGPANCPIMIPLMDKNDEGRRSHYLTIQFAIPDAPAADEIVVALGASIGGRPHHRIGDRYQDLKDLGHDVKNPAAV